MARIKVLELPSQVVGEFVKVPFALIIDQADDHFEHPSITAFTDAVGAAAVLVTPDTLDIDRE